MRFSEEKSTKRNDGELKVYGPFIGRFRARKAGLTRFFTGKPCQYGNIEIFKRDIQVMVNSP